MKNCVPLMGLVGLILAAYGLVSAIFYASVVWYSFFVIGLTLFLGYLNHLLGNESLFKRRIIDVLKIYVLYVFFTVIIELWVAS